MKHYFGDFKCKRNETMNKTVEVRWFQERLSDGDINLEGLGQLYRLDSFITRLIMFKSLISGWQVHKIIMLYLSLFAPSQQRQWTRLKTRRVSWRALDTDAKKLWVAWFSHLHGFSEPWSRVVLCQGALFPGLVLRTCKFVPFWYDLKSGFFGG